MSWQRGSKRTRQFHDDKQDALGSAQAGRPDTVIGKKGWGIKDTADALGFSHRHVHEDLKLSEVADDPKFANLSRQEALDKIKGTSTITLEKILADAVKLSLIKMVEPMTIEKGKEARAILQKAWSMYNERKYRGGSEKAS